MGEVKGCWELFFLTQSNVQKFKNCEKWKELFFQISIWELIQSRQKEYYDVSGVSDKQADSARFVELMLEIIRGSLKEVTVVGHFVAQDSVQNKTPP